MTTNIPLTRVLAIAVLYVCVEFMISNELLRLHHSRSLSVSTLAQNANDNNRYLIFDAPNLPTQGAGNLMHGLLAAQLLGMEYHRFVCVQYPDFVQHFTYVDPLLEQECSRVLQQEDREQHNSPSSKRVIRVVNYDKTYDECRVHSLLRSSAPVIRFVGNSYPGPWPSSLPPEMQFQRHYQPRKLLRDLLPASSFQNIVHLRFPDGPSDIRQGLDTNSLARLQHHLLVNNNQSNSTYLITNQATLYETFSSWSHPDWRVVHHSALPLSWSNNTVKITAVTKQHEDMTTQRATQAQQLWADWYSIVVMTNSTIYHTRSDFSSSAVHWSQNEHSYILRGLDAAGELVIDHEVWWAGEDMLLSQRRMTCYR